MIYFVTALLSTSVRVTSRRKAANATLASVATRDELGPLSQPLTAQKTNSEFELGLGRCIETLRADFPEFMERELVWDIYAQDVEVRDPSGVQLQGLTNYKKVFALVRVFRRFLIDDASVTYKLRYDWGQRRIIVSWWSQWTARGARKAAFVDGISYFYVNDDGKIARHEIDNVVVNSDPLMPPYGYGWMHFREYVLAGLARQPAPVVMSETLQMAKNDEGPLGNILPQTCENIWDCENGLACCDYGLFKICCDDGFRVPAFQPIPIPVPVEPVPRRQS